MNFTLKKATQFCAALAIFQPALALATPHEAALTASHISPQAVSYFKEAENFSAMAGVQLEFTQDPNGGGFNVGYVDAGDWLAYGDVNDPASLLTIPASGEYTIEYRIATVHGDRTIGIDLNAGAIKLPETQVPNTGDWQSWQTISQKVQLDQGSYTVGVTTSTGGWNLNWFRVYSENGQQQDIVPLYDSTTALEPDAQWETATALHTRFSDRPRTRHAKEDQFQSYDHYIKFYFEHRSSNIEIIDTIPKGGNTITMNVRTLWPLDDTEAENRWWYMGRNTVAHYVGNGTMQYLGTTVENGVTYYNYTKTDNLNRQFNRPIEMGDLMEFEISQFSQGIPRGQNNYYGSTFLYIVGEGLVPWYTENTGEFIEFCCEFQEDSRRLPEEYWLGGKHSTLHYQYTDEPDNHFMQMATYLGYYNAQKFLEGRRVHHSSTVDGTHDEDLSNGVLEGMPGLSSVRYVNNRCSDCHERNGSAPVAANGELLDRWVFKVGDVDGLPHPDYGKVLQPLGAAGEGKVAIAHWTEKGGLRTPNYQFDGPRPETFSARIAPRLVGLGLLEAIPESTVLAMADPDDADGDGISGRVNTVIDPQTGEARLGRFGWKAGTFSVKHQIVSAFNTDMGVRSSMLPELDCGANQSNCGNGSPVISDEKIEKLTTYISALGVRPQRGMKAGIGEDQEIVHGKQVFRDIGCTGCHTETIQTSAFAPMTENRDQTIHPYTDMLLHDMGPGLADNLGEGDASGAEWRTTPLWGLGLSACVTGGVTNPTGMEGDEVCTPHHAYLHDGRARSIEEAILWHGGEGQASNDKFQSLNASDKAAILKFLNAL
ncbi:hypothetical protein TDB9533_03221 [Thalassocella blandensis]|nr:hypothetical protein TDB9533_03221 [Thalassocella blandensis]